VCSNQDLPFCNLICHPNLRTTHLGNLCNLEYLTNDSPPDFYSRTSPSHNQNTRHHPQWCYLYTLCMYFLRFPLEGNNPQNNYHMLFVQSWCQYVYLHYTLYKHCYDYGWRHWLQHHCCSVLTGTHRKLLFWRVLWNIYPHCKWYNLFLRRVGLDFLCHQCCTCRRHTFDHNRWFFQWLSNTCRHCKWYNRFDYRVLLRW
jgi:hypothetical protein